MRNLMMSAAKGDPAAVMVALKIAGNLELEREAKVAKNPPLTTEERHRGRNGNYQPSSRKAPKKVGRSEIETAR